MVKPLVPPMVDILGPYPATPQHALARPGKTGDAAGAGFSWMKDCTDDNAEDGTPITAEFLNNLKAQLLTVFQESGISIDDADAMLAYAIQSGGLNYALATGTANAWVVNPALALPAYAAGRVLWIRAPATNTNTAVNMDVSGLGNRRVKKADGSDPAITDIVSGRWYPTFDDGTSICIVTPLPSDARAAVLSTGECQLQLSGANLQLSRKNGSQIVVNGAPVVIPVAGPTLAATGAAANTTYSIYAYVDGAGALQLERSTTARATGADGTEIKTGDATRAFVGLARANGSAVWEDSPSKRFVRSYFNRKPVPLWNRFTADRSTSALEVGKVEINSEIRCEFVCFSDDSIAVTSAGYFFNSAANFTYCSVAFDGTTTDTGTISACFGTAGSVLNAARNAGPGLNPLADGYHYATLVGYVSGGTGTWGGGASNTPTCAIHAMIH
jgi:hypothetical protein